MSGAAGPVSGSANIRLQGEIPSMAEWIRVASGKPEAQQSSEKRAIPQKTMGCRDIQSIPLKFPDISASMKYSN